MKNIFFVLIGLFTIFSYAQEPTDCVNSVVVCGNSTLNLDVNGFGIQEVNSCSSSEHQSVWLKLTMASSGTLGFTLTPDSTALTEDYDFFIYGPNVLVII